MINPDITSLSIKTPLDETINICLNESFANNQFVLQTICGWYFCIFQKERTP